MTTLTAEPIVRTPFDAQQARDATALASVGPNNGRSLWNTRPHTPAVAVERPIRRNASDINDIHHLFDRPEWMSSGNCRGVDPNLFFTTRGESTEDAKAVCATCPVTTQCLQYALGNVEMFGIWGGLTEQERRPLRRQRNADRKASA